MKLGFRAKRQLAGKRVFGEPLSSILERQRAGGIRLPIPLIVQDCVTYLVKEGLTVEGIFRVPGSKTDISNLIAKYNLGESIDLSSVSDPHVVASLFKQYLRELPDSIIPVSALQRYETWEKEPHPDLFELRRIIFKIPESNRKLLECVITLLLFVSKHADVNQMTVNNLAVVVAPNLVRSKSNSVTVDLFNLPVRMVETLIRNYGVFTAEESEWTRMQLKAERSADHPGTNSGVNEPALERDVVSLNERRINDMFLPVSSKHTIMRTTEQLFTSIQSLMGFMEAELQNSNRELSELHQIQASSDQEEASLETKKEELIKKIEALQTIIIQYESTYGAGLESCDVTSDRSSIPDRTRSAAHETSSEPGSEYASFRLEDEHSVASHGGIPQEELEILKDLVESQKKDIESYDEALREIQLIMSRKDQEHMEVAKQHEKLKAIASRNLEAIETLTQEKLEAEQQLSQHVRVLQYIMDGAYQSKLLPWPPKAETSESIKPDQDDTEQGSLRSLNGKLLRDRMIDVSQELTQLKRIHDQLQSQNDNLTLELDALKARLTTPAYVENTDAPLKASEKERFASMIADRDTNLEVMKALVSRKDQEISTLQQNLVQRDTEYATLLAKATLIDEQVEKLKDVIAQQELDMQKRMSQFRQLNERMTVMQRERDDAIQSLQASSGTISQTADHSVVVSSLEAKIKLLQKEIDSVTDVIGNTVLVIEQHNARTLPLSASNPVKKARHLESLVLGMIKYLNDQSEFILNLYDELGLDPSEKQTIILSKIIELKKANSLRRSTSASMQNASQEQENIANRLRSIMVEYEQSQSQSAGSASLGFGDLSTANALLMAVKSELETQFGQRKRLESLLESKNEEIKRLLASLDSTRSENRTLSRTKSLDLEKHGDIQARFTICRQNYFKLCSLILQSFNSMTRIERPDFVPIPADPPALERRDIPFAEAQRYCNAVHRSVESSLSFARFIEPIAQEVSRCIQSDGILEEVWKEKKLPRDPPVSTHGIHLTIANSLLGLQSYLGRYERATDELFNTILKNITRGNLPKDTSSLQKLELAKEFIERQASRLQKVEAEALRLKRLEESSSESLSYITTPRGVDSSTGHKGVNEISAASARIKELEAENESLRTLTSGLAKMHQLESEVARLRVIETKASRMVELERDAERLRDAEGKLIRLADLEAQVARISELESEIVGLRHAEAEVNRLREVEKEVARLVEVESKLVRMKQLEAEVTRLRELEPLVARVKPLEAEVARLQQVEGELVRLKHIELEVLRLRELEKEVIRLRDVENRYNKVKPLEADVVRLRELETVLSSQCAQLQGELSSMRETERVLLARTEHLESELSKKQDLEAKLVHLRQFESDAKRLQEHQEQSGAQRKILETELVRLQQYEHDAQEKVSLLESEISRLRETETLLVLRSQQLDQDVSRYRDNERLLSSRLVEFEAENNRLIEAEALATSRAESALAELQYSRQMESVSSQRSQQLEEENTKLLDTESRLLSKMRDMEMEISRLLEVEGRMARLQVIDAEYRRLCEQEDTLLRRCEELEQVIDESQQKTVDLSSTLQRKDADIQRLLSAQAHYTDRINELEAQISHLRGSESNVSATSHKLMEELSLAKALEGTLKNRLVETENEIFRMAQVESLHLQRIHALDAEVFQLKSIEMELNQRLATEQIEMERLRSVEYRLSLDTADLQKTIEELQNTRSSQAEEMRLQIQRINEVTMEWEARVFSAEARRSELMAENDGYKQQITSSAQELEILRTKFDAKEVDNKQLKQVCIKLEEALQASEAELKKIALADQQKDILVSDLQNQIQALKSDQVSANMASQDLNVEMTRLKEMESRAISKLQKYETEIKRLRDLEKDNDALISQLQKQVHDLESNQVSANMASQDLNVEMTRLKEIESRAISKLQKYETEIQALNSSEREKVLLISDLQNQIQALKSDQVSANMASQDLNVEVTRLKEMESRAISKLQKYETEIKRLRDLEKDNDALISQLQKQVHDLESNQVSANMASQDLNVEMTRLKEIESRAISKLQKYETEIKRLRDLEKEKDVMISELKESSGSSRSISLNAYQLDQSSQFQAQIDAWKSSEFAYKERISQLEEIVASLQSVGSESRQETKKLVDENAQLQLLGQELNTRINKLELEERLLKEREETLKASISDLQSALKLAHEENQGLSSKLLLVDTDLRNSRTKENHARNRCQELEEELEQANEQALMITDKNQQLEHDNASLKDRESALLNRLQKAETDLLRIMESEKKPDHVTKLEAELRSMRDVEARLVTRLQKYEKEVLRLREAGAQVAVSVSSYTENDGRVAGQQTQQLESEVRRLQEVEAKLVSRCQQLEQEVSLLKKHRGDSVLSGHRQDDLERIQKLERELSRLQQLETDMGKLQKLEADNQRLQNQYQTLECEKDILARENQQYRKERDIYKNSYETLQADHTATLDSMETLRIKLKEAHAFGRKESEERTKLLEEVNELYHKQQAQATSTAAEAQRKLEAVQASPTVKSPESQSAVIMAPIMVGASYSTGIESSFSRSSQSQIVSDADSSNGMVRTNSYQGMPNSVPAARPSPVHRTLSVGEPKYDYAYSNSSVVGDPSSYRSFNSMGMEPRNDTGSISSPQGQTSSTSVVGRVPATTQGAYIVGPGGQTPLNGPQLTTRSWGGNPMVYYHRS